MGMNSTLEEMGPGKSARKYWFPVFFKKRKGVRDFQSKKLGRPGVFPSFPKKNTTPPDPELRVDRLDLRRPRLGFEASLPWTWRQRTESDFIFKFWTVWPHPKRNFCSGFSSNLVKRKWNFFFKFVIGRYTGCEMKEKYHSIFKFLIEYHFFFKFGRGQ